MQHVPLLAAAAIVYALDVDNHIVAVNPVWQSFALENQAEELSFDQVIGNNFITAIACIFANGSMFVVTQMMRHLGLQSVFCNAFEKLLHERLVVVHVLTPPSKSAIPAAVVDKSVLAVAIPNPSF